MNLEKPQNSHEKAKNNPLDELKQAVEGGAKQTLNALREQVGFQELQEPLRQMFQLEKTIPNPGQQAEFSLNNEKVIGTRENGVVIWRDSQGQVIQKAVWLQQITKKQS